jgi:hypothetical protein
MINSMFLNLYGVFLQSIQKIETPTLAVIISSITATIFVITLILTWRNLRETTKVSYSQLVRGFHEDLTNRLDKNSILKTTEDCHRYANDYLNTVDEIAFLAIQKKIPVGIAQYLNRFFAYGLTIIDWYDHMIGEDFKRTAKKNWPYYFTYCQKHGISPNPDDKLPKIMLDYNQLRDKESKNNPQNS